MIRDTEACEDMNDKSKPALSLVTPQARYHYTRLDQIDRLIEAGESDSDNRLHGAADGTMQLTAHQPR